MIKHIVFWNVKEEVANKVEAMTIIKESLEALKDEVAGIISIQVVINEMNSSNRDIALVCEFENIEVLNAYQISDGHVNAGKYIKEVLTDRACFDYKI